MTDRFDGVNINHADSWSAIVLSRDRLRRCRRLTSLDFCTKWCDTGLE